MEWLITILIAGAIGAALIASNRGGDPIQWGLIGFFLPVIGVLLAFTVGKQCPQCQSKIHFQATTCPKCGNATPIEIEPQPTEK